MADRNASRNRCCTDLSKLQVLSFPWSSSLSSSTVQVNNGGRAERWGSECVLHFTRGCPATHTACPRPSQASRSVAVALRRGAVHMGESVPIEGRKSSAAVIVKQRGRRRLSHRRTVLLRRKMQQRPSKVRRVYPCQCHDLSPHCSETGRRCHLQPECPNCRQLKCSTMAGVMHLQRGPGFLGLDGIAPGRSHMDQ